MSKEVCALVRNLLESTAIYVSGNIHGNANKEAYVRAMRRCYYICSEEANGNDLNSMLKDLRKLKRELPSSFKPRLEIFSDVKRHYTMGVDQAIDIVSSINVRFMVGHSTPDEVFVRNILGRKQ